MLSSVATYSVKKGACRCAASVDCGLGKDAASGDCGRAEDATNLDCGWVEDAASVDCNLVADSFVCGSIAASVEYGRVVATVDCGWVDDAASVDSSRTKGKEGNSKDTSATETKISSSMLWRSKPRSELHV